MKNYAEHLKYMVNFLQNEEESDNEEEKSIEKKNGKTNKMIDNEHIKDTKRKGFIKYPYYLHNKKERAYTLGAINGIGDIDILKAPLMNPMKTDVVPPILQLPASTNLIKNVHLKVEGNINLDKSYKYRKQNSNKDILNNIKPLYSLPEKVMSYCMNANVNADYKENNNNINNNNINNNNNNIDNINDNNYYKDDCHKRVNEELIKNNKEHNSNEKNNINTKDKMNLEYMDISDNTFISKNNIQILPKENEVEILLKKNLPSNEEIINILNEKKENDKFDELNKICIKKNIYTKECNNNNMTIYKNAEKINPYETKLIERKQEETNENNIFCKNRNLIRKNICTDNTNMLKKNNPQEIKDINKINEQLKIFEQNQIMSPTLKNALKMLSNDIYV
ncbi:conserved Plasmodium protein, unknown function [Plasmodium sp. gorilla clade G2]|uniref:conserved Plasmodium protein, unknown function n=1 Tax=Plasmodium sp. gorilla clade G2 TaxID=880535 RepID=UPI000D223E4F|nr:conserved Plasmodium protein, unknown function [Plasmodium sp. gorilla clade G2]SOV12685.1 conserved Plasmodium protein, unknown function [Plasmodium sp. gorilla clade G2]